MPDFLSLPSLSLKSPIESWSPVKIYTRFSSFSYFNLHLRANSLHQYPVSADYDEPLRIELLQLATLLLKYLQTDLVHHRKELIKFGWNRLKREDSASKQWAFVNVCHFLEAYQAPEKIILQITGDLQLNLLDRLSVGRNRDKENKGNADIDLLSQNSDNINHNSGAVEPKHPVDGSTFSEDPTRRLKVEPGYVTRWCLVNPNVETPGSAGQLDEEFKPNAAMEEMIINFLIRV